MKKDGKALIIIRVVLERKYFHHHMEMLKGHNDQIANPWFGGDNYTHNINTEIIVENAIVSGLSRIINIILNIKRKCDG